MDRNAADAYLPIAAYGAIGNLRTVALVGRNGSIDWCCLPELAGPSTFGALLDARRGGRFQVAPQGGGWGEQHYLGASCALETRFEAPGGRLCVTDFMPLRSSIIGTGDPETEPAIYRLVRCEEGEVEVDVLWAPRFDYARRAPRMSRDGVCFVARAGREQIAVRGLEEEARVEETEYGPVVRARFFLRAGQTRVLITRYQSDAPGAKGAALEEMDVDPERVERLLRKTCRIWETWAYDNEDIPVSEWAGDWHSLVTRSELTLKLLTHPGTGAIAAAATTSLPEEIGGVRNWDYRFSWIRDSVFTMQALFAMGHSAEAYSFLRFLQEAAQAEEQQEWRLQIMYGLHGEFDLQEMELAHLEGYRGSRPVRVGNDAARQVQHDTLGDLLGATFELARRDRAHPPALRDFLVRVADRACAAWDQPDHGIWEVRGAPRNFVYSKVLLWTALDRAVRLAESGELRGNVQAWDRARQKLRARILRQGYDAGAGTFVQSFGSRSLDAANLLIPLRGFLPAADPRVQGTVNRTLEHLTENGLVYRYRTDDGLPGGEGAFGICTFWLVSVLARSGRLEEAREIFEGMLARANSVGLFSEQIDPRTGDFLGNYPQAFTHVGLINSALYLAHAEGRKVPFTPGVFVSREAEGQV